MKASNCVVAECVTE